MTKGEVELGTAWWEQIQQGGIYERIWPGCKQGRVKQQWSMGHIKGTSSRTDVRAVTRSAALDRRATEVPIMSGWNEQSNGGEGEGMPRPTRTGNSIVYASSVTAVQGDMGPQA